MTFHEDWFGERSQLAVAALAIRTTGRQGDIVEVGCWEGRSTIAIANNVLPATVHAVDTWEGSPGEESAQIAAERDVYAQFTQNVAELAAGNIVAHRMGWREYFNGHQDPIRFCHIDATHSYTEVKANIEAVRPLMVPGGIICGDDAHHPPVIDAVLDTLGGYDPLATLWVWEAPHG